MKVNIFGAIKFNIMARKFRVIFLTSTHRALRHLFEFSGGTSSPTNFFVGRLFVLPSHFVDRRLVKNCKLIKPTCDKKLFIHMIRLGVYFHDVSLIPSVTRLARWNSFTPQYD